VIPIVSSSDIVSLIAVKEKKFTKTDNKIASFVKNHLNEIIYMSITELTDAIETSEGSLVRFCQKLGFTGFHTFKIALATQQSHFSVKNIDHLSGEALSQLKEELTQRNLEAVRKTSETLSMEALEQAIKRIVAANRIILLGSGASGNSAKELFYGLMRLGLNVVYEPDVHYDAMMASLLKKNDLIIAISQSGSTYQVVEISSIGKKQGAQIISVTSHLRSPLAELSDIVLLIPGRLSPFESGQIYPRAAQLFAIKLMTLGVATALSDSDEAIKKTADSVAQWIY
jgi:DNA-binding MurR/RpiR family transcriptional regulator